MSTRAALKRAGAVGITQTQLNENRRIQYEAAMTEAHTAIEGAETAIAGVEAAPDLATAQAAVSGVGASLSDARTGMEDVYPNLA